MQLYKLLLKIRDGDEDAMGEFYNHTIRLVFGYCLRILTNPSEAEEAAHDVYMYVWKNAYKYDPDKGDLITWLLVVTRSRSIEKMRKLKNQLNLDEDELVKRSNKILNTPEDSMEVRQKKQQINSALSKLNDRHRKVIELSFYKGMSHSEISKKIDIPLGSVKSSIRLAMVSLKNELNDYVEEYAIAR